MRASIGLTEINCAVWNERLMYLPCSVLFVVVVHFYDLCYKVLDIIMVIHSARLYEAEESWCSVLYSNAI